MSFQRSFFLNTGASIPEIGLGTWQSEPNEVGNSMEFAVKGGYRLLDLAHIYGNQDEVGSALKRAVPSVVKREELFIVSKLWNTSHRPENVEKELDITLKELGLDYLDLYLVHWPVAFVPGEELTPLDPKNPDSVALDLETSLVDTWKAMIKLPKSKVKAIGVSNFTIEQIEAIVEATGVQPAVNQIEAHPLLPQDDLVNYLEAENIRIMAYSPLGNNTVGKPLLLENDVVKAVALRLGATEAQVLIAWGSRRGYVVIPKSVHADRIKSNFQQVELSDIDYEMINAVGRAIPTRYNIPYTFKPRWDINVFGEPEEEKATNEVKLS